MTSITPKPKHDNLTPSLNGKAILPVENAFLAWLRSQGGDLAVQVYYAIVIARFYVDVASAGYPPTQDAAHDALANLGTARDWLEKNA